MTRARWHIGAGALALGVALLASPARAADLTVWIQGMRSSQGSVRIAIYDDAAAFQARDVSRAFAAFQSRATAGRMGITIHDLPAGKYAVAVHHDEDGNGKMNKGMILPTEGFGFSNGASCFGIPSFQDASVVVGTENLTVTIEMKYC